MRLMQELTYFFEIEAGMQMSAPRLKELRTIIGSAMQEVHGSDRLNLHTAMKLLDKLLLTMEKAEKKKEKSMKYKTCDVCCL